MGSYLKIRILLCMIMVMKIKVNYSEKYCVYMKYSSIEIETDDYPELSGMTYDEMKIYISEYSDGMDPVNTNSYYSLRDQLKNMDIEQDIYYDDTSRVSFDDEKYL